MAREVLGDGGDVVGVGVDGVDLSVGLHVGGAGLERVLHHLVLVYIAVLVVDDDDALLIEAPAHAAGLTHVAAVLVKGVTHVARGAVAVVGHGLDYDGDAARAVALVGHGLVVIRAAGAESLVYRALDVVVGHIRCLGLCDDRGETGVVGGVAAAALLDRDYHLAGNLGKGLSPLGVLRALGFLYVMPLGMSGQSCQPQFV